MIYTPHPYQDHASEHLLQYPEAGLLMEMGLGKTVATLTAVDILLFDLFAVKKVLVVAPKRVAEHTWSTESEKWDHLQHLKLSIVLGTEKQRKEALRVKADIYVINRENVAWLVSLYGSAWPFDMVVLDELSSFKSAKSARFKALRMIRPLIKRLVGLTGTPAPNGLLDLWPQMYLLDQGQRLGKTLTGYRDKYFKAGRRNGYVVYNYDQNKGDDLLGEDIYEKEIYEKIGDICISMKAKDWLDLPGRVDRVVDVHLSQKTLDQYYEFEKKMILALEDEEEISAVNAAALSGKLLQFANGAVYTGDGGYYEVHNDKIEALGEMLEAANGKPLLVFYSFRSDVERIKKYLREFKPHLLNGTDDIDRWNRKEIPFLLAHPASAGHGLNMQEGGNLVGWFGSTWSLELYQQATARVDRQGQKEIVLNNRLAAVGTIDFDQIASLDNKTHGQEALMQAVKARINKYRSITRAQK